MSTTISTADYFGMWIAQATDEQRNNALVMLEKVNAALVLAEKAGAVLHVNPKTKTHVSGEIYGGFRPADCPIGAKTSSHKTGRGVDVFDPSGVLDHWFFTNQDVLKSLGLYMEHPDATPTWCHLTDRPPRSGRTVFRP